MPKIELEANALPPKITATPDGNTNDVSAKILAAVSLIPIGFVSSYRSVAARAGLPGRARLVARTLKLADDANLPWHRVIRADGSCAVPGQQALLEAEGVRFRRMRYREARVESEFIWKGRVQIQTPQALDQFLWQL